MDKLCKIRDIYRSVAAFELDFEKQYNLCLNEGMLLCSLNKNKCLTSGEIAEKLGITTSNASKVLKSVENKMLVKRVLGEKDKRQMYFSLSDKGKKKLSEINCDCIEMPSLLQDVLQLLDK